MVPLTVLFLATAAAAATAAPRIALYTFADERYQRQFATALQSKRCYCALHGYTFVLDSEADSGARQGPGPRACHSHTVCVL